MAQANRAAKDAALSVVARRLEEGSAEIVRANAADVEDLRARGGSAAMLDRLLLHDARISAMASAVRDVGALPDPVGEVISRTTRPNGLVVTRVRVPIGVIAMIYESRPNVTVEASALTLKAGNAVVLRGGSESLRSNLALAGVVTRALGESGLPEDAVVVLDSTERTDVERLVQQVGLVDLAIPRGGEALIRAVTEQARVPVVQHYKGVCHLFVDEGAPAEGARDVVVNAKLSRPGVCNALECLLVHEACASVVLPLVLGALHERGCELRGCDRTAAIFPAARPAKEDDFGREFLDRILAVRVVRDLDGALDHIARYGSQHTEAILTGTLAHAERFRREVDAACVVVNASTRFHDGGELGLGAEIGIATSRLHWRGPMGLESLTTMKWIIDGEGQVR